MADNDMDALMAEFDAEIESVTQAAEQKEAEAKVSKAPTSQNNTMIPNVVEVVGMRSVPQHSSIIMSGPALKKAKVEVTSPAPVATMTSQGGLVIASDQLHAQKASKHAASTAVAATKTNTSNSSIIAPAAAPTPVPATKKPKERNFIRVGGGQVWTDKTLAEWPENDYRIFCGDLGSEVNNDALSRMFQKFPSFNKAKVIRDPQGKSKGFGFASFSSALECTRAIKELNGKYCMNRPITLKRSTLQKRSAEGLSRKNVKKLKKMKRMF